MNSQSDFVREICNELNILCESLSSGYVMRLTKGDFSRRIFGSYWDINSAASDRIACDKTASYALLEKSGIPAIKHELIYNPLRRPEYTRKDGELSHAAQFLSKYKKVVIKPNQGTKGQDIFFCQTMSELEAAAAAIFLNHPDAALSPYREIKNEYRVFYINGSCRFVYGKAKGQTWQHNLSQGALAFEIPHDECAKLTDLAIKAAKCIGITFATIDIAESADELAVMEINSGVQAKQLLEQLPHLRPIIKEIYKEAIDLLMRERLP